MTVTLHRRHVGIVVLAFALAVVWWHVQEPAAADQTYTPVSPCAIFDSRPSSGGPGILDGFEEWQVQISGAAPTTQGSTPGGCGIPATASSVQINIVAVDAVTEGNLRVFEPGGTYNGGIVNYRNLPATLNNSNAAIIPIAPCVAPLPSTERCLVIQPNPGGHGAVPTVQARGIVLGYTDTALTDRVDALVGQVVALRSEVDDLQALLADVDRATVRGRDTLRFSGMNLQLVDGSGDTPCRGGGFQLQPWEDCNGLGNLIIGYAEGTEPRSGAHGLVVGDNHSFTSFGHLIGGLTNTVTNANGSALGVGNTVSGSGATVSGGAANTASGMSASVTGGLSNQATDWGATVSGGGNNVASAQQATVSGGSGRSATANTNWVAGSLFEAS